ncbi:MAG: aspartate kinase [Erysipelotrichaceae bacterium]|nr:aspartate kinase [Erysipelotrichaceae bacterium]
MIKVAKFGGSSLADEIQFQKVKQIVESEAERKFVVVSACGKANEEEHKVTDLLYLCAAHLHYGVSAESLFVPIEEKYRRIKERLGLKIDLDREFEEIRSHFDKEIDTDYLVSRGEYLTAKLLAEYLDAQFVDAKDFIRFIHNDEVDLEKSREKFFKLIDTDKKIVIPGFYGTLPNGNIKVMSRGGSDITGAIIANLVDADVYENWTDVSGIYVADPRIIRNSLSCKRLTYRELRGMSYMGANVLHDDAIFPVREKNIPINIRNTNKPNHPGTMIMNDCSELDAKDPPRIITGITGKQGYTVITVVKNHSSTLVGFLRELLSIFEEYRVSIESVPITVDTFSIIVSSKAVSNNLYEILNRIKQTFQPDDMRVDENVALVAVVGRRMQSLPGISGSLLSEFGRNAINIKVINQSADELSIVVGVENSDFEKAINCIYERFVLAQEETL